jgi:hypothetical protein
MNSYIVRLKDDTLFCFYYINGKGISFKEFINNKWSKEQSLLLTGSDNFTVSIDVEGFIYLVCQDSVGDLSISNNKNGSWESRVILKNQAASIYKISMQPIFTQTGMSLIYNIPSQDDKGHNLVLQSLNDSGVWSPAARIDKFYATHGKMYQLQMLNSSHGILFYQTRGTENILGYREITPDKFGNFYSFYKSSYQVLDSSFLTTASTIHVLFIVKTMFSSQLLYKKKDNNEFSTSTVIWDAPRMDNCHLFFSNDNLYISYVNNGHLYMCMSEDKGNTFSKPIKYRKKFCLHPVKANYISETSQRENVYFVRQLYVDREAPWDIQLMSDMSEEFYEISNTQEPVFVQTTVKIPENETAQVFNSYDEKVIERDSLEEKSKQILEKEAQINYITNLVKKRNEDFIDIENIYKNKIESLSLENKQLRKELENIEYKDDNLTTKSEPSKYDTQINVEVQEINGEFQNTEFEIDF